MTSLDPAAADRQLQCLDCGLILKPEEAQSILSHGVLVYPLCINHYGRRIDTREGNP